MSPHRRVAVVLAASAALATLGAATDGSARAADVARHYVALGDSYAAGPGIPAQRADPIGCYRSTNNYPALLARALNIRNYIDVSCSGATTDNMTSAQPSPLGPNPPQFNALKPDTDLVTVTIGANDIDIGDLWSSCARLGPTDPLGSPCQRQSTAGGVDLYAQRVAAAASKVARVLDGIRQRSPRAMVVLVGYVRVVPSTTGCYPDLSIARGDVSYMDNVQQQLTAMLADQARKHSAAFVDSYTNAADHDACQPPGVKWAEGTAPTSSATPMHPNATGMAAVTGLVLDKLASIAQRITARASSSEIPHFTDGEV